MFKNDLFNNKIKNYGIIKFFQFNQNYNKNYMYNGTMEEIYGLTTGRSNGKMRLSNLTKFLSPALFRKFTRASSVDLSHKIHGNSPANSKGTPIIVIHGLLGTKRNWATVSNKLADSTQRCVVAVDVRNHGDSPHTNSHTYPELAADIIRLMGNLSIPKVAIIGHSMGGRTGMVVALTEPSKVASLVVVDISPVSSPNVLNGFFPELVKIMKTVDFQGAKNITEAKNLAKDKFRASGLVENVDSLHFVLNHIGQRSDNKLGWKLNVDTLNEYFTTIATFPSEMTGKQYPGPTLFVAGELSHFVPPDDINGIKNFFPSAELKYVPNVGHNVHAEDTQTFIKIVNEFLLKNK